MKILIILIPLILVGCSDSKAERVKVFASIIKDCPVGGRATLELRMSYWGNQAVAKCSYIKRKIKKSKDSKDTKVIF